MANINLTFVLFIDTPKVASPSEKPDIQFKLS